jgi:hypothetical protein
MCRWELDVRDRVTVLRCILLESINQFQISGIAGRPSLSVELGRGAQVIEDSIRVHECPYIGHGKPVGRSRRKNNDGFGEAVEDEAHVFLVVWAWCSRNSMLSTQ